MGESLSVIDGVLPLGARAAGPPVPPGGPPGGVQRASTHAFTLVEILVVISIFLLLMGLTIGAVVRTPAINRMLAAEQVLGDAIRQARHTARTSAAPVVLRLDKDHREISGFVRQTLWQGSDNWPSAGGVFLGRTGDGLLVPDGYSTLATALTAAEVGSAPGPKPGDLMAGSAGWTLSGMSRLNRGRTSKPDGLWVSLWVKTPIAGQSPSGLVKRSIVPLILIGPDASQPGFATLDSSSLGVALFRIDPSPVATVEPAAMPDGRLGPAIPCWDIVGWIRDAAGTNRIEVSSVHKDQHPVDLQANIVENTNRMLLQPGAANLLPALPSVPVEVKATDIAAPLIGGQWMEIGLLYADNRLVLYRDGRRIAEVPANLANLPVHPGDTERIVVGWLAGPLNQDPDGAGLLTANDAIAADDTSVDDIRIDRLGGVIAGTLPPGVMLDQNRRIICHPDGRVEVAGNVAGSPDTTILLTSVSGEKASLEITASGMVKKTGVTP